MASVYLNPGKSIWMMQFFQNGRRVRRSSETTSKMAAQTMANDFESLGRKGVPMTKDVGKLTFHGASKMLIDDYALNDKRSARSVEYRLRLHLEPYFGDCKMAAITGADATDYAVQRRARHCSVCDWWDVERVEPRTCPACGEPTKNGAKAGTVNRELSYLRRMFTLAVRSGRLLHRPHIEMVQGEAKAVRRGFFELAQFEAVRAQLPAPLQPVVTFAYITGWRVDSEVLPLEWSRVDLDGGEVWLHKSKNDDPRVFPMTDELRALLVERDEERKRLAAAGVITPFVFFRLVATKRGGAAAASPKVAKPIKRFDKAWELACETAGVPGRLVHDFRRTAIRNMVRRGISEPVAMALAGHKTREVFRRYNIVSEDDKREAAAKLSGLGAPAARSGAPRRTFGKAAAR